LPWFSKIEKNPSEFGTIPQIPKLPGADCQNIVDVFYLGTSFGHIHSIALTVTIESKYPADKPISQLSYEEPL
jgi:hypothetical protein